MLAGATYEVGRFQLTGGDWLVIFTDGVVEARTETRLFGTERRSHALRELGADASAETLLAKVVAATDRRPDDMAACMLELDGAPVAQERKRENPGAPLDSRAETKPNAAAAKAETLTYTGKVK